MFTETQKFNILDCDYGHLYSDVTKGGDMFLHVHFNKWSKDNYLDMLDIFTEVLDGLKEKGIKKVYALVPKADEFRYKLAAMFGFELEFALENPDTKEVKQLILSRST